MRVDLGRAIKVKPGDVVWIQGRLPKTMLEKEHHARLTVWSKYGNDNYSPHIQIAAMGLVRDGKPDMVSPMRLTLIPAMPVRETTFIADDVLNIIVKQEVDRADDPRAKVKIKRYSLRWYRFKQRVKYFISALRAKVVPQ